MAEREKILEVRDLNISFKTDSGIVNAIRGVNLDLYRGETIAIVGESGSGKSVTTKAIMGIMAGNGSIDGGSINYTWTDENTGERITKDICQLSEKEMQSEIRGRKIAMVFQDPMTSLNPLFTVGDQLTEHLIKHKKISKKEANEKAIKMLDMVGIPSPEKRLKQYPHEFSGGMRQRVMIAMSLICEPKLIIADEPTTALDVTIQAQILDLMKDLKSKLDTSIILITHDLGVVADLCSRINVMYGGLIVEEGTTEDIFYRGKHPYTWGLLRSVPNPKSELKEKLIPIEGQPPDLLKPPVGCPFTARCDYAMKICKEKQPPLFEVGEGHRAACWLCHENAPKVESPIRGEE